MADDDPLRSTAIHEAGHAVMQRRVSSWRYSGQVSIEPDHDAGTAGHADMEEISWCIDEAVAAEDTLVALAGYAALAAQDHPQADRGCGDDFERAQRMVEGWKLGMLDQWKAKAVAMMREPANLAAVNFIADWLVALHRIDPDVVDMLIEVADGNVTANGFNRFLVGRHDERPPLLLHDGQLVEVLHDAQSPAGRYRVRPLRG